MAVYMFDCKKGRGTWANQEEQFYLYISIQFYLYISIQVQAVDEKSRGEPYDLNLCKFCFKL